VSASVIRPAFVGWHPLGLATPGPQWMPADEGGVSQMTCLLPGHCCPQLTDCHQLAYYLHRAHRELICCTAFSQPAFVVGFPAGLCAELTGAMELRGVS